MTVKKKLLGILVLGFLILGVFSISYFQNKKDLLEGKKWTYISCINIEAKYERIIAFNKDRLKWEYLPTEDKFAFIKFVEKFNQNEAHYVGVMNQIGNTGSIHIDRVKGTMLNLYSLGGELKGEKYDCKKIKKPKRVIIKNKF